MRSAELPADLATIAREATRNGSQLAPARTARTSGFAFSACATTSRGSFFVSPRSTSIWKPL